jgi:hypothetical protein
MTARDDLTAALAAYDEACNTATLHNVLAAARRLLAAEGDGSRDEDQPPWTALLPDGTEKTFDNYPEWSGYVQGVNDMRAINRAAAEGDGECHSCQQARSQAERAGDPNHASAKYTAHGTFRAAEGDGSRDEPTEAMIQAGVDAYVTMLAAPHRTVRANIETALRAALADGWGDGSPRTPTEPKEPTP